MCFNYLGEQKAAGRKEATKNKKVKFTQAP